MDLITEEVIDLSRVLSLDVHGSLVGAVVLFSGEVRADKHNDKEVSYLHYDVKKDMAWDKIAEVVSYAKDRWSLSYAFCAHRVGRIEISECAIVIVTSSGHRKEAYEANRYILDTVKREAPIWKKEVYTDGTHKWG